MSEPTSAPPGLAGRMSGKEWPIRYVFFAVLIYAFLQTGVFYYKIMIKGEHPSEDVRKAKREAENAAKQP